MEEAGAVADECKGPVLCCDGKARGGGPALALLSCWRLVSATSEDLQDLSEWWTGRSKIELAVRAEAHEIEMVAIRLAVDQDQAGGRRGSPDDLFTARSARDRDGGG